ncbi:cysteine desulfurase-like protein [Trichocoleus sp. FACHB-262]|uniref:cysteine desulfurase-like protein n=1 Tax=Trichocoleus sp. FACHB-262 TaxID=2692869 RepID=UPI001F5560EE|nr:cysteine desulfurase-like protein [Trichocoleus sp. FACHB-262]
MSLSSLALDSFHQNKPSTQININGETFMIALDLNWIRSQFPALTQEINGQPAIFCDGPGGTQVPKAVVDAMSDYLLTSNANAHGAFATSQRTDALIAAARDAVADFLNCGSDEVVFGANMTTLTYTISRAIGRALQPGDEIIVTALDHYANVCSWQALAERGIVVRTVDIHPEDCTLNWEELTRSLNERTKLVAIGYASNAVGTINDVAKIAQLAHQVGAWVYVDAVHYAPHGAIDVQTLDCDFLVCSAYKFFGPHLGILYGKREHLARLQPYKVLPAPDEVPSRWETGTQNYEGMAGLLATLSYLTELGHRVDPSVQNRRAALTAVTSAIHTYEAELSQALLRGFLEIPGLTIYGITELSRLSERTPTFGLRIKGYTPAELATQLGDRGIFTWHGHFYALGVIERLELAASGGLLRIGLVHYNTMDEVNRLLQALHEMTEPVGAGFVNRLSSQHIS